MLSLATSHIAHQCNQLNHDAQPILCHVLKALFFNKIALELSYFAKTCKIFERWGLRPQTPRIAPFFANFWQRACMSANKLKFISLSP